MGSEMCIRDRAFSASAGSESDGGLSYRMLGALLTWMQEKKEGVFLIATANNLKALPPELLRKGRFDEIFFVDLPDATEREEILKIHLSIRKQDPERFDLKRLVRVTEGFSGAEIEQMVISALYRALYQEIRLDTGILEREAASTIPLSKSRREEIRELQNWAQERFVSVR